MENEKFDYYTDTPTADELVSHVDDIEIKWALDKNYDAMQETLKKGSLYLQARLFRIVLDSVEKMELKTEEQRSIMIRTLSSSMLVTFVANIIADKSTNAMFTTDISDDLVKILNDIKAQKKDGKVYSGAILKA